MCPNWLAIAKATELVGALLLLIPLYKAAIVQWSYLSRSTAHTRKVLGNLRINAEQGAALDTVALAAALLHDKPVIVANRFSRVDLAIISLGTLLFLAGAGMEIVERMHLMKSVCPTDQI